MKNLRVALVVPNNENREKYRNTRRALLKKKCRAGEIDLVIYPECFEGAPTLDDAVSVVRRLAEDIGAPVLSGVSIREGYEAAAFVNPDPGPSDTPEHLYVKHTSAGRIAFQKPGYRGRKDPMFQPIQISGRKLGVMICHDMFYGLITALCLEKGATGLVDLTGGNVKLKKWKTIAQARSIEARGPFFCTMARLGDIFLKSQSEAFAFYDGAEMPVLDGYTQPDGIGGFKIFPWLIDNPVTRVRQNYSPKKYTDILVSLGGSEKADIQIQLIDRGVEINGKPGIKDGQWHGFDFSVGHTGVVALPLKAVFDPMRLYKERPKLGEYKHHIVLYYAHRTPRDMERVLAMVRLRAIEHRVAVAIIAGKMKEMIKTDNYKHVQRLRERNSVFGLNRRNIGGTYTSHGKAIPEGLFDNYLALV